MSAVWEDPEGAAELCRAASFGRKTTVSSPGGLAIASHPLVSRVAADVLGAGGNACDAALAAAVAQTVVEPHMSTITGVLSMLHWDQASGCATYVNGSAAAPSASLAGFSARDLRTGRGVAVPGFWAGLEAALGRHGTWPLARIVEPAIRLGRDGIEVYPFLYGELFLQANGVGRTEAGRAIFMPAGRLLEPGERLVQHGAASLLERLAERGAEEFYGGAFAAALVDTVRAAGGVLTREDLEAYEARWCEPARGTYRDVEVVASPPPDQGGSHLVEMLNLAEQLPLPDWGPANESPDTLEWLVHIHNAVFADGAQQRDPRSFPLPLETILSKDYARHRLGMLRMDRPPVAPAPPGSNHLTVVDAEGNVATLLHSCMSRPWATGLFVEGVSIAAAGAHYLRVLPSPGDRISSIIAPTMLFRDGRPWLAAGSPSISLLAALLQLVVHLVDFELSVEDTVHRPRFGGFSSDPIAEHPGATMAEADLGEDLLAEVGRRGVPLAPVAPWTYENGSLEAIVIDPVTGARSACGDPRRNSQPMAAP